MADDVEKQVVDDKQPDSPAFDAAAIGKQAADAAVAQVKATLEAQPHQPESAVVQEPQDALAAVLEPYVTRATNRSTLIAQMAADKADFYTVSDPDELEDRIFYKDEIEKRALGLAQSGRALPREDILKHLKGEKFEEVEKRRSVRRAKREERARQEGGDEGSGGSPRPRGGGETHVTVDRAYGLQGEGKLDEFLDSKEF